MSELKTLKDMGSGRKDILDDWLHKSDLREEAIKWYHRSDGNKHRFIMEFFNLTEEEIKSASKASSKLGEKQ